MTVGVAWLRTAAKWNELWVATDSRLTGDGHIWDECPKVTLLPRRDAIIGFSGATAQAYPLIFQVSHAIDGFAPAQNGVLELLDLYGHIQGVANSMLGSIKVDPLVNATRSGRPPFATSGDTLVLGGYSRQQGDFVLRRLRYVLYPQPRWAVTNVRRGGPRFGDRLISVFGDALSVSFYTEMLHKRLPADMRRWTESRGHRVDLEPLEVLWEFLALPESNAARPAFGTRPWRSGGSPQVVSVMPGAEAQVFAVRWSNDVFLFGRRLLGYERLTVPLIEPSGGIPMLSVFAPARGDARGASRYPHRATGADTAWRAPGYRQEAQGLSAAFPSRSRHVPETALHTLAQLEVATAAHLGSNEFGRYDVVGPYRS